LVTCLGKGNYDERNQHILGQVEKARTNLHTKNSAIGKIDLRVFSTGEELRAQVPAELDGTVKRALGAVSKSCTLSWKARCHEH
jgi:hypothetical protein